MAEAEEVIGDAARHLAAHAWGLWRRWRTAGEPPPFELAAVRRRLELLVEALLGEPVALRAANPPAPPSALARLWRRAPAHAGCDLPATDGISIFLPARLAAADEAAACAQWRAMALRQALRRRRGTAQWYPHAHPRAIADLYLLSEAAAVERELVALAPGYGESLDAERRACLAARPPRESMSREAQWLEALYRGLLETPAGATAPGLIAAAQPRDSLAWAEALAREGSVLHAALARDGFLGDILRPEADRASVREPTDEPTASERAATLSAAQLRRRPRVRHPDEDEEDAQASVWMVQTSEPIEHAEDPMGLQRPTDRDAGADPAGLGDSLAELPEARLVRTPQPAKEVLLADDPPRVQKPGSAASGADERLLTYPEWDYRIAAYRPAAVTVRLALPQDGPQEWVDAVLARRRAMLLQVRRRFEAIRARRSLERQLPEGEEIDLDAYVQSHAEVRARLPRSERLYQLHRPARRDIALMMLVDVSGSTDAWVAAGQRVIDVEKEALLIVAVALQALGLPHAILAWSGCGPRAVVVSALKPFEKPADGGIARRIAALEPQEFTRTGAALRHALGELMRVPACRRLLLLVSDGKPNDIDEYEGRYGIEDVRQAVREAQSRDVDTYALTVDRNAASYLPRIFGPHRYTVLREPQALAGALVEWLRQAALAVQ